MAHTSNIPLLTLLAALDGIGSNLRLPLEPAKFF